MTLKRERRKIIDFIRAYGRVSYRLLAPRLTWTQQLALSEAIQAGELRKYHREEDPGSVYLEIAERQPRESWR